MEEFAIVAEGLGKRYRLDDRPVYETLRDTIARKSRNLFRLDSANAAKPDNFLWALRNVDFKVRRDEAFGIVGRNGSGKSTLLKLLSRITDPTEGQASVRGRIGAMLEIGTGFHPEMTGRENVYFSGSILGLTRREISRTFDEIVAFSGVEEFIDTIVKHYSTGMRARLAFSVAAYLQPDILLIDEVLSVGDIEFQQRSFQKMHSMINEEGRAVLIVTHAPEQIRSLCNHAMWLDKGEIMAIGPAGQIVDMYLEELGADHDTISASGGKRPGDGPMRFERVCLHDPNGSPISKVYCRSPFHLSVAYGSAVAQPIENATLRVHLRDESGRAIITMSTLATNDRPGKLPPRGTLTCIINEFPVTSGNFTLEIEAHIGGRLSDFVVLTGFLTVAGGSWLGNLDLAKEMGMIHAPHRWEVSSRAVGGLELTGT